MSDKEKLEKGTKALLDFQKLRNVYQRVITEGQNDVIPVVVQDVDSREVLILAYVNEEALSYSLANKVATFWSTSRNKLWIKGETSGSTLALCEVRVNCEQNSLLFLVRPVNGCGACHVIGEDGRFRQSCYYRTLVADSSGLSLINQTKGV